MWSDQSTLYFYWSSWENWQYVDFLPQFEMDFCQLKKKTFSVPSFFLSVWCVMSTLRSMSTVLGYAGPYSICAQCTSLGGVSFAMLAIPGWAPFLLCRVGLPSYLVMRKKQNSKHSSTGCWLEQKEHRITHMVLSETDGFRRPIGSI